MTRRGHGAGCETTACRVQMQRAYFVRSDKVCNYSCSRGSQKSTDGSGVCRLLFQPRFLFNKDRMLCRFISARTTKYNGKRLDQEQELLSISCLPFCKTA